LILRISEIKNQHCFATTQSRKYMLHRFRLKTKQQQQQQQLLSSTFLLLARLSLVSTLFLDRFTNYYLCLNICFLDMPIDDPNSNGLIRMIRCEKGLRGTS
jgi:hypothetical protein